MSIIDSSSDDRPIFMIRLVDDNGCSMTGGAAQVGNVGIAVCMRSATSWRAVMRSVPGSKIITIDEYWGTDLERMTSSPGTPLSACSIGMVIKCFDVGRGETEAGGLHLHLRRREFGEDVHRHGAELSAAEDHHRHGETDDEVSELQARSDYPTHHGRGPPRHCNGNGFPERCVVRSLTPRSGTSRYG